MKCEIELDGFGTVKLTSPRSLVAINDLVAEFSAASEKRSLLARLCAGLVGVCWSEENEKSFPVYDLSKGDILAFGTECLDFLLKSGCTLESVYNETLPLFSVLWDQMPKAKEVAAKEAFFREEGSNGSIGAEDREMVGA